MTEGNELIRAEGVGRSFASRRTSMWSATEAVQAVVDVSIGIRRGETFGLVGESGSGKSTLGRIMLGMMKPTQGRVLWHGTDLAGLDPAERAGFRRRVQMIFQDPLGNLDPRMRVLAQVREALDIHAEGTPEERKRKALATLASVGIDENLAQRYPHQLSGGQQQRVVIARAIILDPDLVICDEPVSALDVSVQAQVLNLLSRLQAELGLAYLFISHDLAVVRYICHRIAVLYLGRIVEEAETEALFAEPRHPYTRALIRSVPVADPAARRKREVLQGELPDPGSLPPGCAFATRCSLATDRCRAEAPALQTDSDGHAVACHLVETAGTRA
ncbi:ABC transporter ATP-binding protein [Frigidibacter sp. ROC022]|uniref:ABC transporter ATP-binding protein n=1 Tax=Frigidibacter sp. ROC022 TaxID=2971796 RepID=UPI00215B42F2|nr:oligopeptide/dipeptide ABC transporter ATP-binding protein [Frigidibacter sp. ROC022]MCR8723901.1 ATP-binding cassette domain-containing protein [Frigidibacter sp. ROC022]